MTSPLTYICLGVYSFLMKLSETPIFTALADPTRLRILNLLMEGELCVCDVMSVLKEPQSKISRHLAYLREAGLVEARKQGLWMYYSLATPSLRLVRAVLESLTSARSEFEELKRDVNEFHKIKSGLVACCK